MIYYKFLGHDDIIILVGDTPSYLQPLLKKNRKVLNFAISNKPFGCFHPPYGKGKEWSEIMKDAKNSDTFSDIFTPTSEYLNAYFDYLDNETELTRDFVKKFWYKIILVDSSGGASIHGVSIFFNRYVGNIIQESDNNIICTKIEGAKPIQFIRIRDSWRKTINIDYKISKILDVPITNYRPELIIYIGSSIFNHRTDFMIFEAYPRIVPFYIWHDWKIPPNEVDSVNGTRNTYDAAVANFEKLEMMLEKYIELKDDVKWKDFFDKINLDTLKDKTDYFNPY